MTRRFGSKPGRVSCARATFLLLISSACLLAADVAPRKYTVQVTASVQDSQIRLSWPSEGDANSYTIHRRTLDSGWQQLAAIGGGETSFTDGNANPGTPYEYQIVKQTGAYTGYGFIRAGNRVQLPDNRGKLLLLVENSPSSALGGELDRLQRDLTADGWVVIRRNVSMHDSPQSVKEVIRSVYNSDPGNVKALFLFGHIPVAYSGNIAPDEHANHRGAWPADVFYGDINGSWTDHTVNTTTAERAANHNVPGDGKFDQGEIPSHVELMVGRVDLHNMTCYANKANSRSEIDLLRNYLNKNHAFRIGDIPVERRAIICDNFGDKGDDPIAGSAWRTFSGAVGGNIQEVPWDGYFPAVTAGSYLWSYGSGGGTYYYSMGVGTSDEFALKDVKVVFTMFMGSYFGDWNNESNFLRAALGSGHILTSSYSGFPHSIYFPMSLGETVGFCMQLSQNNSSGGLYPPWEQGSHEVHIALHGDPTLRLHPVKPAGNLAANSSSGRVNLSWNASPDSNLQGYHVYRSTSAEGPFTRVTTQPTATTSFSDSPPQGAYTYMVRAIKLEQSPSGTYLNPSLGVFASATVTGTPLPQPPAAPTLQADAASHSQVNLRWNDVSNETNYQIERRAGGSWSEIATLGANTTTHSDQGLSGSTEYFYRIRALNDAGASPYSAEVRVTTPAAPQPQSTVTFIEQDDTTIGNWWQKFGRDGFAIAGGQNSLPFADTLNTAQTFTWEASTDDPRALVTAPSASTRAAIGWYGDPVRFDLDVGDTTRRVALYMVDWDRSSRSQTITISDAATGIAMSTREITSFPGGAYLVYDIRGNVRFTIEKNSGPNALLQGVFVGGNIQPPVSNEALQLRVRLASPNAWIVTVSGDPGQRFRLESSNDLRAWNPVTTGALVNSSSEIQLPIDPSQPRTFLRTVNTQ